MSFQPTTSDAMVSPVVTHLHLIRHGRVDIGSRRLAYGWADLPLSPAGEAENERVLRFLRRTLPRPAGVFCSDLRRCREPAERLAAGFDVPLTVVPDLREQQMGDWEGLAWDDLQVRYGTAVNDYWDRYAEARPPRGETLAEAAARVVAWWTSAFPRLEGRSWVIVGHVGSIRALLCHLLGLPVGDALRFAPAHGSHTHVLVAESGVVVQVLGAVPHAGEGPDPPSPPAEQYAAGPSARGSVRRIALSGSAGTGKSTLGRRLAYELGVPFIEEGMRRRLEAGLDFHRLDPDEHRRLLEELWLEQVAAEDWAVADSGGFVADRSPVDFATFALLFQSHEAAFCERFVGAALARASSVDRVLLLPWGVLPLVHDGTRSTNRWYQRRFQVAVEGMLSREVDPGRLWRLPGLTELDDRLAWVLERVRRPGLLR